MPLEASSDFGFERQWLSLSLRIIPEKRSIFSDKKEAQQYFGIGVKKIEALKVWLRWLRLANFDKQNKASLTEIAMLIKNYDQYFEEKGTWQILHYFLSSDSQNATAYYWFSNIFPDKKFSSISMRDKMIAHFPNYSTQYVSNGALSLMKIFALTPIGNDIGILKKIDKEKFEKTDVTKDKISQHIVAFVITDWANRNKRDTVNIAELFQAGSPARIFNMNKTILDEYLDTIQMTYEKNLFWVSRTAGLNSISMNKDIAPIKILKIFYEEKVKGVNTKDAIKQIFSEK